MQHNLFYDKGHHFKSFGRSGAVKKGDDKEDLMNKGAVQTADADPS